MTPISTPADHADPGDVAQREHHQRDVGGDRAAAVDHPAVERRQQAAVAEHRALRHARRAAGVDQPGEVVLADVDRRVVVGRGGEQLVVVDVGDPGRVGAAEDDDRLHRRQLVADAGDRLGVRVLDEQHGRLGVGDDAAQLRGREAVVEEREAHAGHRHAEVGVDELRPVLRQDRHAVAGCGDRRARRWPGASSGRAGR